MMIGSISLIDVIAAVIVLIAAVIGAKNGIFKVLVNCAAYVGAVFISRMASTPLSQFIYTNFIQQKMTERLASVLPSGQTVSLTLNDILPEKVVRIAEFLHLYPDEDMLSSLNSALSAENIESKFISPIVTKILMIVCVIVLFVILAVVLRVLARSLNRILFKNRKGAVSALNRILGFVFGIIKGALPVCVICEVLNLIAPLIDNAAFIETVSSSYLCSFIGGLIH